jgi:hypothetical protein
MRCVFFREMACSCAVVSVSDWRAHERQSGATLAGYSTVAVGEASNLLQRAMLRDPQLLDRLYATFVVTGANSATHFDRRGQRYARSDALLRRLGNPVAPSPRNLDSADCLVVRRPVFNRELMEAHGRREEALRQSQRRELRPVSEQHWLELRVVDPKNRPLSGVRVEISPADGELRASSTDADGFVYLMPIPAGDCGIRLPDLDARGWKPKSGGRPILVRKEKARSHTVEGTREDLGAIAKYYGIGDWKVIWDDPKNEVLRKRRKHPSGLRAGDTVALPPVEICELVRPADSSHVIEVTPVEPLPRQVWSI